MGTAEISLTAFLLCSGGSSEEEINCMEKKAKKKEDMKQEKGDGRSQRTGCEG